MKSCISKFKYYIIGLIALLCFAVGGIYALPNGAKADVGTTVNLEYVSPGSDMEYYELTSPKDACLWDTGVAIIMGDNTLHVYTANGYQTVSFSNVIYQVKKYGDELIVSSDLGLDKIDLSDLSKTQLLDKNGDEISGLYFDFNSNYLVTSSDNTISIYSIDSEGAFVFSNKNEANTYESTRISIDDINNVFYINDLNEPKIYKSNVTNFGVEPTAIVTAVPNAMDVTNEYLFYALGNKIYRVNLDKGSTDEFIPQSQYDLGKLTMPNGIFVKGDGKLIITDKSVGAVQEFEIDDSKATPTLNFTGFAIAKGLSAYNRILNTVSEIEKFDDVIVTLDSQNLTVIKNGKFNKIAFSDARLNFTPNALAVCKDGTLLTDGETIKLLGYAKELDVTIALPNLSSTNKVKDLYYQSGYFYAVTLDDVGTASVYKINEKSKAVSLCFTETTVVNPLIAVDVFENIYFSNDGDVYLHPAKTDYEKVQTAIVSFTSPTEITVDLEGKIYAMFSDGKVQIFDGVISDYALQTLVTGSALDFAFDVNEGKIYLVFNGEEVILSTLTDETVNPLSYDNAPNNLFEPKAYISDYTFDVSVPSSRFIAVDVNIYYLPKLTKTDKFAILESQTAKRIAVGTEISPISKLLVDNVEFYRVVIDGTEGYIPVNFTTDKFYAPPINKDYTVNKVSNTTVYSNDLLETEIDTLLDGESVRVLDIANGVARIEYFDGTEWKLGFISSSAIVTPPNTAIRNVLIIIIVLTSITSTALFFILRKKS